MYYFIEFRQHFKFRITAYVLQDPINYYATYYCCYYYYNLT